MWNASDKGKLLIQEFRLIRLIYLQRDFTVWTPSGIQADRSLSPKFSYAYNILSGIHFWMSCGLHVEDNFLELGHVHVMWNACGYYVECMLFAIKAMTVKASTR